MEHAPLTAFHGLLMALLYSVVGVAVFAAAFVVIDRLTPGDLWKELIEEKNTAIAILFGACAIALAIVIAAAIG